MRLIALTLLAIGCCPVQAQQDANGWTVLQPSSASRVIYVSSAGDDTNDGLSDVTPKQTIEAGKALLRKDSPDWLLLRCGDTFGSPGDIRFFTCGASPTAKQVWSCYGSGDRPKITAKVWFGEGVVPLKHVAFVGLHFYEPANDPDNPAYTGLSTRIGLQVLATKSEDVLIEDCKFSYCRNQCMFQGALATPLTGITIRRNIFEAGTEFGLQLNFCRDCVLSENVFDRNGWEKRNVRLHNVYTKEASGCRIVGNILSRGGNAGLKHAADNPAGSTDWTIEDNLFNRNYLGLGHSNAGQYDANTLFSHARGAVLNNVFLKVGKTIPFDSTSTQAIGMNIDNITDSLFQGNVFAHNDEVLSGGEIFKFGDERNENVAAVNNVVHNWQSVTRNQTGSYVRMTPNVFNFLEANNLQENVLFADSSRSLVTYAETLGETEDSFLKTACNRPRKEWDTRYTAADANAWIRAGFVITGQGPEPMPEPPPEDDPAVTVRKSDIDALIIAVEGVLFVLKTIAERN